MDEELLTLKEVRAYLKCSLALVYKLATREEFEMIKVGGSSRVPKSSFDAFIARQRAAPVYKSKPAA